MHMHNCTLPIYTDNPRKMDSAGVTLDEQILGEIRRVVLRRLVMGDPHSRKPTLRHDPCVQAVRIPRRGQPAAEAESGYI